MDTDIEHASSRMPAPGKTDDGGIASAGPFPSAKPLLNDQDLPGPLSINMLTGFGTLSQLDSTHAYQTEHADTLYGRATIVGQLAPKRTIACAFTALWIWMGGMFPDTIDVISRSHYRSIVHGRRIRVFNRKSKPEQIIKIGSMPVTTPARTACDLALLPKREMESHNVEQLIEQLMLEYQVSPQACLDILNINRFWPHAPIARNLFEQLSP